MSQRKTTLPFAGLLMCALTFSTPDTSFGATDPPAGPEAVVGSLYELVTFPGGTQPDWDSARAMFLGEAVVVLRTSREGNTVFSVEGWIDDFVTFIENSVAKEQGFGETVVKMETVAMGDIANVWVLYESKLPGRPAREGVDNFSLVRRDGVWLIASIVNELPIGGIEVPEELRSGSHQ